MDCLRSLRAVLYCWSFSTDEDVAVRVKQNSFYWIEMNFFHKFIFLGFSLRARLYSLLMSLILSQWLCALQAVAGREYVIVGLIEPVRIIQLPDQFVDILYFSMRVEGSDSQPVKWKYRSQLCSSFFEKFAGFWLVLALSYFNILRILFAFFLRPMILARLL